MNIGKLFASVSIEAWRLVKVYGKTYAEPKYRCDKTWSGILYRVSKEPKPHWIWNDELGVYRSNVSAFSM